MKSILAFTYTKKKKKRKKKEHLLYCGYVVRIKLQLPVPRCD